MTKVGGGCVKVYILSKNGTPIMPTNNHDKVRLLLKQRIPFTIQL